MVSIAIHAPHRELAHDERLAKIFSLSRLSDRLESIEFALGQHRYPITKPRRRERYAHARDAFHILASRGQEREPASVCSIDAAPVQVLSVPDLVREQTTQLVVLASSCCAVLSCSKKNNSHLVYEWKVEIKPTRRSALPRRCIGSRSYWSTSYKSKKCCMFLYTNTRSSANINVEYATHHETLCALRKSNLLTQNFSEDKNAEGLGDEHRLLCRWTIRVLHRGIQNSEHTHTREHGKSTTPESDHPLNTDLKRPSHFLRARETPIPIVNCGPHILLMREDEEEHHPTHTNLT